MINDVESFGETMAEQTLVKGLRELNPDLVFDPAGKLGHYHPMLDNRFGVWLNDRHVSAMERGPAIPEFNVWVVQPVTKELSHIVRVGWRHTLDNLVNKGVPGVTWVTLLKKFGIERKVFTGDPMQTEATACLPQ